MYSGLSAAAAEWKPASSAGVHSAATSSSYTVASTHQHQQQPQHHDDQHQQPMTVEDAIARLHSWYPTHAPALLRQLVEGCDCDVQQAARILSDMEFEQRRSRIAAAAAASGGSGGGGSSSRQPNLTAGSTRAAKNFNYSMEQFPALGGGCANSSAGHTSAVRSNWAAVTSKPPTAANSTQQPAHARTTPAAAAKATAGAGRTGDAAASDAAAVPWVETGTAVSQEYSAARAEASDHARVRNACFNQATIAYRAGDKALAKELSAKGKAAAEAMWQAHERASSHIFSTRNARLQQQVAGGNSSSRGAAAAVIDLHGLHVAEMMQWLPQQLAALSAQQHDTASVIVGVGKHTKGPPTARMGPAVEALLKDLGYSFRQPQPGLLRVRLR